MVSGIPIVFDETSLFIILFFASIPLNIFFVLLNTKIFKKKGSIAMALSQDVSYHFHLDTSVWGGYANGKDVWSNIIFFFVGLVGAFVCVLKKEDAAWLWFFISFAMVSFGSALYHSKPNNWLLVFDRLPMTVGFMSAFCVFDRKNTSEYIWTYAGLGIASCGIWCLSLLFNYDSNFKWKWNFIGNQSKNSLLDMKSHIEMLKWQKNLKKKEDILNVNHEHLKNNKQKAYMLNSTDQCIWVSEYARNFIPKDLLLPYLIVQFYPLTIILYMMITQWNSIEHPIGCLVLFLSYMLAKIMESFDIKYSKTGTGINILKMTANRVSGHTMKHIIAGLGPLYLIFEMMLD